MSGTARRQLKAREAANASARPSTRPPAPLRLTQMARKTSATCALSSAGAQEHQRRHQMRPANQPSPEHPLAAAEERSSRWTCIQCGARENRRRPFTIFLRRGRRSLCDLYQHGGSLRSPIRGWRPWYTTYVRNESPQSLPDPDASREPVRVPNEAVVGQATDGALAGSAIFRSFASRRWSAAPYGIPPEQVHQVNVMIER